ncbi:histidine phosphatase family protein [Streptomyces filipinensis]|uniref:histidine phosphatase family protein n=1 Tax=Streptomyces filipinensis TaxID=66887 RepID=UPI0036ED104E
MTIRLTLVCARPADTFADAVFGHALDSEYDPRGAGAASASLRPHSWAVRSPSSGSALTAAALGLAATSEPVLRDIDYGAWRGGAVADIVAADPHGYSVWLTDPDAAPHGGETVRQLCRRAAAWLDGLPEETDAALVIAEPAVVRALLVHALSAPVRAFWTLRAPPLSTVCLTRHGDRWYIQSAETPTDQGVAWRAPLPRRPLSGHRRPVSHRGTYACGHRAASPGGDGPQRRGTAA